MYTILIVEDDEPKYTHIKEYIEGLLTEVTIVHKKSVNSAVECLEELIPDLLILDMSLPTVDITVDDNGGRPQGFGGIEILREMSVESIVCPTIVITGYSAFKKDRENRMTLGELSKELHEEFPEILKGVLHFNSAFSEWQIELNKVISEIKG